MESLHNRIYPLLAILLIPGISAAQITDNCPKEKEFTMSAAHENKEIVRKLYEKSLNRRNLKSLQNIISDDYEGINGNRGAAGFQEPVKALIKALPDSQWEIEKIIGEGDEVVIKWKLQGTHNGPFRNIEATGRTVSNDGIGIYELKDGKIINAQVYTDRLGFLQDLEVLPSDLSLLPNPGDQSNHIRFIDRFTLPQKGRQEFLERVNINRNFIKRLPGFIEDAAYERTDEQGNMIFVTVAVWENEKALNKAKKAVLAEYEKQGFNPSEMFERLNITMERGTFKEVRP